MSHRSLWDGRLAADTANRRLFKGVTVLDFLVTATGLRVILYGVVVTTFALGALCMTVLIVGYRDRRPVKHRRSVRRARPA